MHSLLKTYPFQIGLSNINIKIIISVRNNEEIVRNLKKKKYSQYLCKHPQSQANTSNLSKFLFLWKYETNFSFNSNHLNSKIELIDFDVVCEIIYLLIRVWGLLWGAKLAFLAEKSGKDSTPPPSLPVSEIIAIFFAFFLFLIKAYIFFETSKLRHGKWSLKKSKMSPEKIHLQRKLEKTLYEWYQNNTAIGVGITLNKKNTHFKTLYFLAAGGQPLPLRGFFR